jgi:hypothetical protein
MIKAVELTDMAVSHHSWQMLCLGLGQGIEEVVDKLLQQALPNLKVEHLIGAGGALH